ncbi:MAG: 3-dehydroquinate synthase [Bacillota bacterium]|jgi:3-dehydroquinate synthase
MKTLTVNIPEHQYNIYIGNNLLGKIGNLADLRRKVMIVTDEGVPKIYADNVYRQCGEAYVERLPQGEGSKSFAGLERILSSLLEKNFSRRDLIIALGGGVMGDLAGFAAAVYMRGIDFINIPTTTLSQIDSSIGGKTAINLNGVKNIVGAFYQPKAVFIDTDTLSTLTERHYLNGLAEAVKAGMIADAELFEQFEKLSLEEIKNEIEDIVSAAVKVKKYVVEQDEKEAGLRKILNFGHTLGHGIESLYNLSGLYHGEAVAIGMMLITENPEIKKRLSRVLQKLNLPVSVKYDKEQVLEIVGHDKKAGGKEIDLISVNQIGKAEIKKTPLTAMGRYL